MAIVVLQHQIELLTRDLEHERELRRHVESDLEQTRSQYDLVNERLSEQSNAAMVAAREQTERHEALMVLTAAATVSTVGPW